MRKNIDYLLGNHLWFLVAAVSLLNITNVAYVCNALNREWTLNTTADIATALSIAISFICVIPIMLFMRNKGKALKALSMLMLSMLLYAVNLVSCYGLLTVLGIEIHSLRNFWFPYDADFSPTLSGGIPSDLIYNTIFSLQLAIPFIVLWLLRNKNIILKFVALPFVVIHWQSHLYKMVEGIQFPLHEIFFYAMPFKLGLTPIGGSMCLIAIILFIAIPLAFSDRKHVKRGGI